MIWNLRLIHEKDLLETNNLNINSGIFQGDSFSPFLYSSNTYLHRT